MNRDSHSWLEVNVQVDLHTHTAILQYICLGYERLNSGAMDRTWDTRHRVRARMD